MTGVRLIRYAVLGQLASASALGGTLLVQVGTSGWCDRVHDNEPSGLYALYFVGVVAAFVSVVVAIFLTALRRDRSSAILLCTSFLLVLGSALAYVFFLAAGLGNGCT